MCYNGEKSINYQKIKKGHSLRWTNTSNCLVINFIIEIKHQIAKFAISEVIIVHLLRRMNTLGEDE